MVHRSPQLIPLDATVSDVLLVEHSPGVHSGAAFVGRIEHRGRRWVAAPLLFGSFSIDPNRVRSFKRQSDAVYWLIEDMMEQLAAAQFIRSAGNEVGEA